MSAEPALVAERVSRRYGRRWAVRHVSATFAFGELATVIGHNGAGKSTLLALLGGLMRPSDGVVYVLGQPLHGFMSRPLRGRVGVLGHQPFVYPELTGRENLELIAGLYARPTAGPNGVDALLARVDLALAAERPARTYSRGMVQRLALARMLLQDADIWLLDEPTTGLDTAGRAFVLDALGEARARGRCVVCVTHDPDVVAPITDRVVALEAGRLIAPAAA